MTALARSWAGTVAKHPLNEPMGVLLAATITTSATMMMMEDLSHRSQLLSATGHC